MHVSASVQWMSGSGVHIFSIMITFYAVYNPLKSAFTVSQGAHSRSCRAHAWCFMPDGKMAAGTRARIDHLTATCAPARVPSHSSAFKNFDDAKMGAPEKMHLVTSKSIFVSMNMMAMTGALYKMSLMGLLPNTPSDWVSFLAVPPNVHFTSGSSVQ